MADRAGAASGERFARPLILIRGFGGPDVRDEQADPYQGFNNGTVYRHRRGENFIYEGFLLRALKSGRYRDATNVVGYYPRESGPTGPTGPVTAAGSAGAGAEDAAAAGGDPASAWPDELTSGSVAVHPEAAREVVEQHGVAGTVWVYRYYDLLPRTLHRYGEGLARLIRIIRHGAGLSPPAGRSPFTGVDIVAHSMGGLVVRSALRQLKEAGKDPAELVHRIVTLGTPHRGIAFQLLPDRLLRALPGFRDAADEFAAFDPGSTEFLQVGRWFPVERILTVVGTDYRSYGPGAASLANRLSSLVDQDTLETNRSDGLVKQSAAQLPGAPRTFVHKCHGGRDSLVTSREAYEIAMRFFHGTHRVGLWLDAAEVTRGEDFFGRSEFWFGVSVKPRYVDFALFDQRPEAENCYGPFDLDRNGEFRSRLPELREALSMPLSAPGDPTTGWLRTGPPNRRWIWEGWLDRTAKPEGRDQDGTLVLRIDLQVGERDTLGIGFHDNLVFRKQYYLQVLPGDPPAALYLHTGERYLARNDPEALDAVPADRPDRPVRAEQEASGAWTFPVGGTGFTGTLGFAVTPEDTEAPGHP
ncbi:triacylglycerol lipase [Streptomyces sp. JJ36]|uniref:esterase/lipase family protein n=1 Tax=Streptomyces sp. JJ36 TaxID=2736645 RepID=UPI001F2CDC88|nr:GPI inositol-deacylase [Streptomyces sp. JJ36]MCF6523810.1 alpha/beta hydrolase [Streptomyces sp. JJ36]